MTILSRPVAIRTVSAGVVDRGEGPRPYVMTDRDVAVMMVRSEHERGISRPSGAPGSVPLDTGVAEGWTMRQRVAANRLEVLWKRAKPILACPSNRCSGSSPRASLSEDDEDSAALAWADYRAAMAEVNRQCGHVHESALLMAVVHGHPPTLGRAWRVRECLTVLANWWGLK